MRRPNKPREKPRKKIGKKKRKKTGWNFSTFFRNRISHEITTCQHHVVV